MAVPVLEGFTGNTVIGVVSPADNTITLTKPPGVVAGDLLVLIAMSDDTGATNDFQPVAGFDNPIKAFGTTTGRVAFSMYSRIADGSEAATEDVVEFGANDKVGWYLRISGARAISPIVDVGVPDRESNAQLHTIDGITTTEADSLAIYMLAFDTGFGSFSIDTGGPAWAEIDQLASRPVTNGCSGTIGQKTIAAVGPTGDVIIDCGLVDSSMQVQFAVVSADAPPARFPVLEDDHEFTAAVSSTEIVLTKPAGVAVDDLLLLVVMSDDNTNSDTFGPLAGWELLFNYGNGASDCKVGVYRRVADGTEPATVTVPSLTGSDDLLGWYIRVTGVDPANPINVIGAEVFDSGDNRLILPEVTTVDDQALALFVLAFERGGGLPFSVTTGGPLWALTAEGQTGTGTANASGCFGQKDVPAAGGSADVTVFASDSEGLVGAQLALTPLPAGPPPPPPTSNIPPTPCNTLDVEGLEQSLDAAVDQHLEAVVPDTTLDADHPDNTLEVC